MALRRMFHQKICHSGQLLKLPPTSRLLFMDLILEADDDGIVDAYVVMKMTGAQEGDLQVLYEKNLVVPLNNNLITYIPSWLEHNKLRSDRKIDSLYLPLLLKMYPDVKYIKSTKRADRKPKKTKQLDSLTEQEILEMEMGRPRDGVGQDRLGQVREGQQQQALGNMVVPDKSNPVVDDLSKIDIRHEFHKRNLPIRIAMAFDQNFDKEIIIKQLYNFDLNKANIKNPIGWLYKAVRENYDITASYEDIDRVQKARMVEQAQVQVLEAEQPEMTSAGEVIVKNQLLAEKAAKFANIVLARDEEEK